MLVFKKKLDVNSDNLDSLTEVARAQLFKSWEAYQGEEARSLSDMFEPDNDEGLAFCEHFQVYEDADDRAPKYDVWVLNSDTASVFYAGTAEETGIAMIQGDFDPLNNEEKDSAMQSLAVDLQEGYSVFIRSESDDDEIDEMDDEEELGEEDIAAEAAVQDDRREVIVADESDVAANESGVAADDTDATENKGEPEMIDPEKQVEKALNAGEEDSELIKDDADSDTQGGGSGSGDGVYRTAVDQVSDPEPVVRLDAVEPVPDAILTAPPKRKAAASKKAAPKKNVAKKTAVKKSVVSKAATPKKKTTVAAPKPKNSVVSKKSSPVKPSGKTTTAKGKPSQSRTAKANATTKTKIKSKTKSGGKSKASATAKVKSKKRK